MTKSAAEQITPTTWRDLYPVHPCADVFPMMSDAEIDALANDIKANGLRQPIVLWQPGRPPADQPERFRVLDGRNRLGALERLGIRIPDNPRDDWVEINGEEGQAIFRRTIGRDPDGMCGEQIISDPAAYVISANIRRRHLTKEQQAELIVRTIEAGKNDTANLARSFNPTDGRRGGSTKDPVRLAAVEEGRKHDISERTIERATAKVKAETSTRRIGVSPTMPKGEARPLGTSRRPASAVAAKPATEPAVKARQMYRLSVVLPGRPADMKAKAAKALGISEDGIEVVKVVGGQQAIDPLTLRHELGPIIDGLKAEGRKNMATMSPGTVAHLTFRLEGILDKLSHPVSDDESEDVASGPEA